MSYNNNETTPIISIRVAKTKTEAEEAWPEEPDFGLSGSGFSREPAVLPATLVLVGCVLKSLAPVVLLITDEMTDDLVATDREGTGCPIEEEEEPEEEVVVEGEEGEEDEREGREEE